jgi:nucleotide-binding universal stress UspA family protein
MMPPPRTRRFRVILAAVDFSRASAKIVRHAVALARAGGGRVVAVHVADSILAAAVAGSADEHARVAEARAELQTLVRRAAGADAASRIECLAIAGAPRQTLESIGRRLHADVLVVGTSGRVADASAAFGSVARGLLRRYPGTMLVIPPACRNPGRSWPRPTACAALPPGTGRRTMVTAATRMTAILGTWLTVVEDATVPSAPLRAASVIIVPLSASRRLRAFRRGNDVYRFILEARRPVIVLHAGQRVGHVVGPRRAA